MKLLRRHALQPWQPLRAAIAGLFAVTAYSLEMEIDMAITGNRFSDVRFIQGLLESKNAPSKRVSLLAWVIHLLNGVCLAELYAAVCKRFLPGPSWLRGIIFGEAFLVSVWWLTPLVDKHHPLIRSGALPRLATWTSFLQNSMRHLVFGLVLGWFYGD